MLRNVDEYKILIEVKSQNDFRLFSLLEDHIKCLNPEVEFLYVSFDKEFYELSLKNGKNSVLLTHISQKSSSYKQELSSSKLEMWCAAERALFGPSYNEQLKEGLESYIAAYSYIFNKIFMPDCILSWDWERMYRHGLDYIAKKYQIKKLFFERCCFPNTSVVDSQGIFINNSLQKFDFDQVKVDYDQLNNYLEKTKEEWSQVLQPCKLQVVPEHFIRKVLIHSVIYLKRLMGLQKYSLGLEIQSPFGQNKFLGKLYLFWCKLTWKKMQNREAKQVQEFKGKYKEIIFIPLQGVFDHILIKFLQDNIPEEIALIFKSHPATIGFLHSEVEKLISTDNRSLLVHRISIYDLITSSRCVVTRNSAVGLQAMVYGKPVFVMGDVFWAPPELHITEQDNVLEKIRTGVDQTKQILYDKILYKLIFQYLEPINPFNPANEQLQNLAIKVMDYINTDKFDPCSRS